MVLALASKCICVALVLASRTTGFGLDVGVENAAASNRSYFDPISWIVSYHAYLDGAAELGRASLSSYGSVVLVLVLVAAAAYVRTTSDK